MNYVYHTNRECDGFRLTKLYINSMPAYNKRLYDDTGDVK